MSLSIQLAEVILQEHLYKTLPEKVHLVGRPFLGFTEQQMLKVSNQMEFLFADRLRLNPNPTHHLKARRVILTASQAKCFNPFLKTIFTMHFFLG